MENDVRSFGEALGRRALARDWMKLELPCSDEQVDSLDFDVFCEVWMALVATRDGLRVGYWSQGAY